MSEIKNEIDLLNFIKQSSECMIILSSDDVLTKAFGRNIDSHHDLHQGCKVTLENISEVITAFPQLIGAFAHINQNKQILIEELQSYLGGPIQEKIEEHQSNTAGCELGNCAQDCAIALGMMKKVASMDLKWMEKNFI